MKRIGTPGGLLVSTLFLVVAVPGGAQERPPQILKSPAAAKVPPAVDSRRPEDPKAGAAAAGFLENAYQGERAPESVRMLAAVMRGSRMGPGEGWFGPAEARYSWKWLAERYGTESVGGGVPRSRFRGPEDWFRRLDRNKDGTITADDFDWSDRSPYLQMSSLTERLFRKLNRHGDGRLTKDELAQFFAKTAQGKEYLSSEDFRDALLGGPSAGPRPDVMPSPATLLRGLFAGELGSMNEGPHVNERAPDFTLKSADGKETVTLTRLLENKPVVLVFGSFT